MKVLKFGFSFLLKNKFRYCMFVITSIMQSIFSLIIPLVQGMVIDDIIGMEVQDFKKWMLVFVLISIGSIINNLISGLLYTVLQSKAGFQSNFSSINNLYKSSYIEYIKKDPAVLNDAINADCNSIIIFCLNYIHNLLLNIVAGILILVIIGYYSWIFSLGIIFSLSLYILNYIYFEKKLYKKEKELKEKAAEYFGKLYILVSYLKSIKINGLEKNSFFKAKNIFKDFYKVTVNRQKKISENQGITMMISIITQILIFYIGGFLVLKNKMTIGVLIIMLNYYSSLLDIIQSIINCGKEYISSKASYDRLKKNIGVHIYEKKNAKRIVNQIRLENVSFGYEKEKKLFTISTQFEKNNIYILDDKNGKGKSTLIYLICGLFQNEYQGKILYDNCEQKDIDMEVFNEYAISVCEQEPYIFDGTIKENICCKTCKRDASVIKKMLEEFDLTGKINSLENKLETPVSCLNTVLSGGEKQKIAIIRTLIADGEVLVFDEPLAALDKKSKVVFQKIIKQVRDKIIIIISHEPLNDIGEDSIHILL